MNIHSWISNVCALADKLCVNKTQIVDIITIKDALSKQNLNFKWIREINNNTIRVYILIYEISINNNTFYIHSY